MDSHSDEAIMTTNEITPHSHSSTISIPSKKVSSLRRDLSFLCNSYKNSESPKFVLCIPQGNRVLFLVESSTGINSAVSIIHQHFSPMYLKFEGPDIVSLHSILKDLKGKLQNQSFNIQLKGLEEGSKVSRVNAIHRGENMEIEIVAPAYKYPKEKDSDMEEMLAFSCYIKDKQPRVEISIDGLEGALKVLKDYERFCRSQKYTLGIVNEDKIHVSFDTGGFLCVSKENYQFSVPIGISNKKGDYNPNMTLTFRKKDLCELVALAKNLGKKDMTFYLLKPHRARVKNCFVHTIDSISTDEAATLAMA